MDGPVRRATFLYFCGGFIGPQRTGGRPQRTVGAGAPFLYFYTGLHQAWEDRAGAGAVPEAISRVLGAISPMALKCAEGRWEPTGAADYHLVTYMF